MDEWDKLAAWIVDNKLFSHNVRWLVQIPRLYNVYKATNIVTNFKDIIQSNSAFILPLIQIFFNLFLK